MRGGVSPEGGRYLLYGESSPRAWGCFLERHTLFSTEGVFPTCVGVFLRVLVESPPCAGLPHVRGGVSKKVGAALEQLRSSPRAWGWSSPRAWGCFRPSTVDLGAPCVFPTCVGVFPGGASPGWSRICLPHVRGGVSHVEKMGEIAERSSPRAWGCFLPETPCAGSSGVFPTCVGVFPHFVGKGVKFERLPHVRGGVSQTELFLFAGK